MRIRIITDGKAGDVVQGRGIAGAILRERPGTVEEFVVRPRLIFVGFMPWGPADPRDAACLGEPFPDIAIASGRRSVPSLRRLRALSPTTFTVFLKDPRVGSRAAHFVWTPLHDKVQVPNIFKTLTSPHPITPAVLAQGAQDAATRFPPTGKKRLLVLLGGPTRGLYYNRALVGRLASWIDQAIAQGYDIRIVPSRRTPAAFCRALKEALAQHPSIYCWDQQSENPYLPLLATADAILAPGDSHNMISEVLLRDVPITIFQPDGKRSKLSNFVLTLIKGGLVSMAGEGPSTEAHRHRAPVDATPLIVGKILEAYDAFRTGRG